MKIFRFAFFFILTVALGVMLDSKVGVVPPLGKFLSPFHGFWKNAENEAINAPTQIDSDFLTDKVRVHFDELLIPHIFAQNDSDLFYTQGYVTAFHRLWQMEFQLLAADGRLSEILGKQALTYDRSQRRMGLGYGARNATELFQSQEPELFKIVEAYTAGVNDFIETLEHSDLPIEYKLLDYKPEPWTPYKCFLFLSNMHKALSGGDTDLENTNALKLWGKDIFDILYPDKHAGIDPIIPRGTSFDFTPLPTPAPDSIYALGFANPLIEKPDPDNGSNSFVVGGQKTANGKVILTNELDLNLTSPSIWYLIHLNTPTMNVMGASFPGVPTIINGFNDSIAWGETNSRADVVDWYSIEFKDESRNEYRYNGNWVPTRKEIEEFEIKGEDSYYDTLIYTHHGPVVYDRNFTRQTEKMNLAMKWLAHNPYKEFKAFYLCDKANNYDDFVEAFSNYSGPAQNISFASASGDIAISLAGQFPLKWEEQGKFIMDGANSRHEWKEFIPYEHNPKVLNPSRGFVSSANQHPVDSLYPYYIYDYHYDYYRGRRINDRLRVMENIEVKDLMDLQYDNFNYLAFESLPMMLESLDSASFTGFDLDYYTTLKNWDYFNEAELDAPTIFKSWWDNLRSKLWDEIDSADVSLARPHWYNTYFVLKNFPDLELIDNQFTEEHESVSDLFRITFKETVKELQAYLAIEGNELTWYRFKNTTIRHLLRINPFSTRNVKVGGYRSIVNAASESHGPSWRMIVELGDGEVNAWGVYPGSQSANPGNPTYGHMVDDWATGDYKKLLFDQTLDTGSNGIVYSILLDPSN
ncbi:MAG: penicillin acylase family protein [Cyclobacteriaceae bacterium]